MTVVMHDIDFKVDTVYKIITENENIEITFRVLNEEEALVLSDNKIDGHDWEGKTIRLGAIRGFIGQNDTLLELYNLNKSL